MINKKLYIRNKLRNFVLSTLYMKNNFLYRDIPYKKPRVQFLYFHSTPKKNINNLISLIDKLSKNNQFISYHDGVNKIINNQIDKSYVVFSADDGFKDNLNLAKTLYDYDIKACFFINPVTINFTKEYDIKRFCENVLNTQYKEFLNWDDINTILKYGHEIGSHTMNHVNVSNINISTFEENIQESYDIIKSKCGKIDHFAWPYGTFQHFTKDAFKVVFSNGFKSCSSAVRGCHVTNQSIDYNKLIIRRDHVDLKEHINHILYFILNNSIKSNFKNNFSPYS